MAALLIPPTRDKSCPPPTPEEEEALASGGFDDIDLKGLAKANDDLMNLMKTDPGLPKETRRRMEIDEERAREEELEKRRSKKDRERIEAEKAARVLPRDRTSSGENTAGGAANASSQVRGQGQGPAGRPQGEGARRRGDAEADRAEDREHAAPDHGHGPRARRRRRRRRGLPLREVLRQHRLHLRPARGHEVPRPRRQGRGEDDHRGPPGPAAVRCFGVATWSFRSGGRAARRYLDGKLNGVVHVDETIWTLTDGELRVQLQKAYPNTHWFHGLTLDEDWRCAW